MRKWILLVYGYTVFLCCLHLYEIFWLVDYWLSFVWRRLCFRLWSWTTPPSPVWSALCKMLKDLRRSHFFKKKVSKSAMLSRSRPPWCPATSARCPRCSRSRPAWTARRSLPPPTASRRASRKSQSGLYMLRWKKSLMVGFNMPCVFSGTLVREQLQEQMSAPCSWSWWLSLLCEANVSFYSCWKSG